MEEQEDKRGFKVQDRRRFSPEGEAKPGADAQESREPIDIIIMLRDKTRGNLDANEQAMLKEILSGLQMKYVELARQPNR